MIEATPVGASLLAAFILLGAVVVFYLPRPAEDRRAVLPIALVAFVVKAALVPLYYWLLQWSGLGGFGYPDPLRYHEWAIEMSAEIKYDLAHQHYGWRILSNGYYIICAYIYSFFGANTMLPRLLNVAVSSMSLLYVYRIGKLFFEPRTAWIGTFLTAALPITLLTVLEQRKDPIAQFLALLAFYHAAKAIRLDPGWGKNVLLAVVPLIPLYFIRSGFILPFLLIMGIGAVLIRRNLATAVAAFVPAVLIFGVVTVVAPEDSRISIRSATERFEGKVRQAEFESRYIGLMRYAYISSPAEIWKAPMSGALVLLTPFPPKLADPHLPTLVGPWLQLFSLALYPFLLVAVANILGDRDRRDRLLLILYPALFLMVIGAVNPSVTRYREVVFPIVLLLSAHGSRLPRSGMAFLAVYGALGGLAVLIWALRLGRG